LKTLIAIMMVISLATTSAVQQVTPVVTEANHSEEVVVVKPKDKPKVDVERTAKINKLLEDFEPPKEVKHDTPVTKSIDWLVNNVNKPDGWSLTGYSMLRLTEDYNPFRIKLGIIDGEMLGSIADNMTEDNRHRGGIGQRELEEWRRWNRDGGVTFGIHICIRF